MEAVVIKEYQPNEEGHLPLQVGEVLKLVEFGDELSLWSGSQINGNVGYFPSSYVQINSGRGRGRGRGRGTGTILSTSHPPSSIPPPPPPPLPIPSPQRNPSPLVINRPRSTGFPSSPTPTPLFKPLENPVPLSSSPPVPNNIPTPPRRGRGNSHSVRGRSPASPTLLSNNNNSNNNNDNNIYNEGKDGPMLPPVPMRPTVSAPSIKVPAPNIPTPPTPPTPPPVPPRQTVVQNSGSPLTRQALKNSCKNLRALAPQVFPSNAINTQTPQKKFKEDSPFIEPDFIHFDQKPDNGNAAEEESPEAKMNKMKELRKKCILEIYQTEKDYILDLETLINVFIFPLRTMAVVPEASLYNIFSNVEVLINCNIEMLKLLEPKVAEMNDNENVLIGECFTVLADYFKMYKVYCANQQNSLTTVDSLYKKNSQFKRNLDICHSDDRCHGLFLQSFLIKPIQRVCKYPLLLRELIRYTPSDNADYDALQSAFTKINEVVTNINEGQREAEGLQRILDLQSQIDGVETLVEPGRKFHKEGDLVYFRNSTSNKGEKRHVFFFSDLIVLSVRKGEKKYEHKLTIPLETCKIIVLADSDSIKNAFELSQESLKNPCILSCESYDELTQWVKEIRTLMKKHVKRKLKIASLS